MGLLLGAGREQGPQQADYDHLGQPAVSQVLDVLAVEGLDWPRPLQPRLPNRTFPDPEGLELLAFWV
jgi:hypothetical protein